MVLLTRYGELKVLLWEEGVAGDAGGDPDVVALSGVGELLAALALKPPLLGLLFDPLGLRDGDFGLFSCEIDELSIIENWIFFLLWPLWPPPTTFKESDNRGGGVFTAAVNWLIIVV